METLIYQPSISIRCGESGVHDGCAADAMGDCTNVAQAAGFWVKRGKGFLRGWER